MIRWGARSHPTDGRSPICYECHINGVERIGSRQEAAWFRERGILSLDLAAALYANSHSLNAMLNVLKTHRQGAADTISDSSSEPGNACLWFRAAVAPAL